MDDAAQHTTSGRTDRASAAAVADGSAMGDRRRRPWLAAPIAGCALAGAGLHASGLAATWPALATLFTAPVAVAALVPACASRGTGSTVAAGLVLSPFAVGGAWIAAALTLGALGLERDPAAFGAGASALALLAAGLGAWFGAARREERTGAGLPTSGRALAAALLLVLGLASAAPWFGGGPRLPAAGAAPDARAAANGNGHLEGAVLDRFLAQAHAARALERGVLPQGDPALAGAPAVERPVAASLRAAWGRTLGLGPFALGAAEALWLVLVVGGAAASFARPRGGGLGVLAPSLAGGAALVGLAAPRLVAAWLPGAWLSGADLPSLTRFAAGDDGALALGLVAAGLALWRAGLLRSPEHESPRPRAAGRWLPAVVLALAALLVPWVGAVGLAVAALASLRGPRPVDRLLPLALAALPGAALAPLPWPAPTTAPGGFAAVGPLLVLAVLAVAWGRGGSSTAASPSARPFPRPSADLRLAAAALVVGAVASSWAGGSAALLALVAAAVPALGLAAAARPGFGALCLVAGLVPMARDLAAGFERGAGPALLGDAGVHRVAARGDRPERVAAAWADAPPPRVFAPTWSPPTDVAERHADDWRALWTYLGTAAELRALDPVLLVEPDAPGPRYGGGARVVLGGGADPIHEGVLLAGIQPYVVRAARPAAHDARPTPGERVDTAAAHLSRSALVAPVHRRRLDALERPVLVPVGPEQRARLRGLEPRLVQLGARELWRRGEVAVFGLPADAFAALPAADGERDGRSP